MTWLRTEPDSLPWSSRSATRVPDGGRSPRETEKRRHEGEARAPAPGGHDGFPTQWMKCKVRPPTHASSLIAAAHSFVVTTARYIRSLRPGSRCQHGSASG